MDGKVIQINGTDYTDFFPKRGYTVLYSKVHGNNEGLMLDGSYTEDTLAVKATVSSVFMPLTEEQQSAFLADLFSDDYATVYYFDPKKNAYRTAVMIYEVAEVKYKGASITGDEYWTGLAVTFTDRFGME